MLSAKDNAYLTQTGKGAPTGELLRRYWIPILTSDELPTPGGPPKRVKLMGESFVAFRDVSGKVAMLDEHCIHRGASLVLGHCDQGGIRCLFHGWKYATDGTLLETPNLPDESPAGRIKAKAYPVEEAGEVIWVYIGPADKKPKLPDFGFMHVEASQRVTNRFSVNCNWAQFLEGGLDSSHVGFLHKTWMSNPQFQFLSDGGPVSTDDAPRFEIATTDFGFHQAALRKADRKQGAHYIRVHSYIAPFGLLIPPNVLTFHVPEDDFNNFTLSVRWSETEHFDRERTRSWSRKGFDENLRFEGSPENRWGQDPTKAVNGESGVGGLVLEDATIATSMGSIVDRSNEHLVSSDCGIVAFRQWMRAAAGALERGEELPPMPDLRDVTAWEDVLTEDERWQERVRHVTQPAVKAPRARPRAAASVG
jgi:phenylpropionate dioxygenase-like ring-hydroxylating dioxygenase large terminal subunit